MVMSFFWTKHETIPFDFSSSSSREWHGISATILDFVDEIEKKYQKKQ